MVRKAITRKAFTRKAFTLVELLIVISLILVLAAIGVIFFPGISEQARAARGGVVLQGWLNVARSTAVRNQAPYGLRLYIDSTNNTVTSCQYVQQPDDFSAGTIQTDPSDATLKTVLISVDPTNGSSNSEEWSIKPGDYLEVGGGGLAHLIPTNPPGAVTSTKIILASPLPYSIGPTSYYRVQRKPRVASDEILELPDQVAVDINTNTLYGNPLPITTDPSGNRYLDILFGPGGDVVTPGVTTASINLWVRDINRGPWDPVAHNFQGDPSIIAIYVRSGLVAAHPPCTDFDTTTNLATQPYKYVNDGRSSGS